MCLILPAVQHYFDYSKKKTFLKILKFTMENKNTAMFDNPLNCLAVNYYIFLVNISNCDT